MNTFTTIITFTLVSAALALPQIKPKGDITSIATDCGSTGGKIVSISMEGCNGDEVDRCEVKKGDTVRGELKFEANKATTKLDCEIFGIIGGLPLPFPGGCPVKDGCSALTGGSCPIEAGETFVYKIEMFIETIFPSASVDGKWTLKDDSGSKFACFIVPIKIA